MKGTSGPLAIENKLPDEDVVFFTGPVDPEDSYDEVDAAIARAQAAEAFGSAAAAEQPEDEREALIAAAEAAEAFGSAAPAEPSIFPPLPPASSS
eukprot:10511477-Prorocentrum_lima.AAC.1